MVSPYTESRKDNVITRKFSPSVNSEELVWHRDRRDRIITIVEGNNWKLQMDNELPVTLKPGDSFSIPKNTYHRVIKGTSDLVVTILEH